MKITFGSRNILVLTLNGIDFINDGYTDGDIFFCGNIEFDKLLESNILKCNKRDIDIDADPILSDDAKCFIDSIVVEKLYGNSVSVYITLKNLNKKIFKKKKISQSSNFGNNIVAGGSITITNSIKSTIIN